MARSRATDKVWVGRRRTHGSVHQRFKLGGFDWLAWLAWPSTSIWSSLMEGGESPRELEREGCLVPHVLLDKISASAIDKKRAGSKNGRGQCRRWGKGPCSHAPGASSPGPDKQPGCFFPCRSVLLVQFLCKLEERRRLILTVSRHIRCY